MTEFTGVVGYRGANGKVSRKEWDLGDFSTGSPGGDFDAALSALDQVATAFLVTTDAIQAYKQLTHKYGVDATIPSSGDVFEQAVLSVGLVGGKVGLVTIPAPEIDIFMTVTGPGRDIVDISNGAVQTLMTELEQHVLLSDGDSIDPAVGLNGLIKGIRRANQFRGG